MLTSNLLKSFSYSLNNFFGDNFSLRRKLFRGGIGCLCLKFFGILLSFFISILLARILGPNEFGTYSFSYSLILLLSIPIQIGLPQLVIRETAKNYILRNWLLLKGLWIWSTSFVLFFSIVIITICFFLLNYFPNHIGAQKEPTLLFALFLVPLLSFCAVNSSFLKGFHNVVIGQLPDNIFRPVFFLCLVLLSANYFTFSQTDSSLIMLYHVIASFFSLISCTLILYKLWPKIFSFSLSSEYEAKNWFFSTIPLAFTAGLQLIISRTDILMLGFLTNNEFVGIYRVSAQFAILISLPLEISHMLLSPYIARFVSQNDKNSFQKTIKICSRFVFVINTFIFLFFLFWGKYFISLFFGSSYLVAYSPMLILAAGRFFNSIFGPVGMVLQMGGRENDALLGVSIAAITNIILNIILIKTIGIIGASLATSLSLILSHSIMYRFVLIRFKIEPSVLFKIGFAKHK